MSLTLEGKIALVTGASRGIGKSIALEVGKQGALVIGTSTSTEGADNITQFLQAENLKGRGLALDIADAASIEQLMSELAEKEGLPHILVNNAGITADNLFLRMKEDEWFRVINTNLTGTYRLIHACLRSMVKAKWGRIVNISSVVGVTGNAGQANYAAAKAGVLGLTKSLAKEIGSRGITVNAVAPGFIDTDMTRILGSDQHKKLLEQIPLGRMGDPKDIANAVLFLVSSYADYITGETLHVNGGMYMC